MSQQDPLTYADVAKLARDIAADAIDSVDDPEDRQALEAFVRDSVNGSDAAFEGSTARDIVSAVSFAIAGVTWEECAALGQIDPKESFGENMCHMATNILTDLSLRALGQLITEAQERAEEEEFLAASAPAA